MDHWKSEVYHINAIMKHEFLLLRVSPNDFEPETNDSEIISPVTGHYVNASVLMNFHKRQDRCSDLFS